MAVDTKQIPKRLIEEAFGKGNLQVFDEVCDPGFRSHDPLTGETNLDGEKELVRGYRTAFPDMKPTILNVVAEGDTVVTQWRMTGTHQKALMGIEPTGRRATVEGISISRFRGGKIVEEWHQWDALGLFRQLGVAPSLEDLARRGATGEQRQRT